MNINERMGRPITVSQLQRDQAEREGGEPVVMAGGFSEYRPTTVSQLQRDQAERERDGEGTLIIDKGDTETVIFRRQRLLINPLPSGSWRLTSSRTKGHLIRSKRGSGLLIG